MSNNRTLILLAIIFAVLSALVALQSDSATISTPSSTPTPQPQASGTLLRVFPDLAVLDMQGIRLEDIASGQNLTLIRDEQGNWHIPDSIGVLDENSASSIARTLAIFPYARSLNILSDTDFNDYGFAPTGQLLFQIIKSDSSSHIIAIGNLTEEEQTYYALVDDRDEIFQVERGPIDFLRNFIFSPPVT